MNATYNALQFASPPDASLIYIGSYNPIWIAVSILLAIFASYVALNASQRIAQQRDNLSRLTWIIISAFTLGVGIWAMHFIGMLALKLPCAIHYDPLTTLLSMIPSILASGVALGVVVWNHGKNHLSVPIGSVLLGTGIGIMHYMGMAAMQMDGFVRYNPYIFALSILVAIALSYLALWVKNRAMKQEKPHHAKVALIMGSAVSGMHYTAMFAAYFIKGDTTALSHSVFNTDSVAVLVVLTTIFLTLFTLVLASFSRNREITQQLRDLTTKLTELNASLEHKVIERTEELQDIHRALNSSIDYASLIQKAILPTQQLTDFLGENQCIVWQPRDVVGGDFYIFHPYEQNYLLGVIDCAGHGIPGALMTMLACTALDHAISQCGISSPALLLSKMDAILRNRLQNAKMSRGLVVNMEAGLFFMDTKQQRGTFAGAKMSLYCADGQQLDEIKGANRSLLDSRTGNYTDIHLAIKPNTTYCIVSDGVLDQAGGTEGFGFGNTRFTHALLQNADKPLAQQAAIMMKNIIVYREDYEQRDDITLLFFKPTDKPQVSSHADN